MGLLWLQVIGIAIFLGGLLVGAWGCGGVNAVAPGNHYQRCRYCLVRGALAKKTATELDAANKQAELLTGVSLKFARKTGENDQMFGSVTTGDIADGSVSGR